MDLRYIQINAATLVGDYDNAQLVAFLRRNIKRASTRLEYWIRELEADRVQGMHEWNNIATVLTMSAGLDGFNAVQPIAYCTIKAQHSQPAHPVILKNDPITRWRAQCSE